MRRPTLLAALLLGSALVGTAAAAPPPAPAAPRRVLVITLDTTRADRLGCYGSDRGLTPVLDAFARRATVFERCQTAIPQTVPSHTTLFSGWDPDRHGVRKNLEVLVPGEVPLLAEAFRGKGYATGAFVSAMVLLGRYGLGRGFQTYEDSFYRVGVPQDAERAAPQTLALAGRWIRAQKEPWFCWVHLFDPHTPYAPPPPFDKRFAGSPYDGEVAAMDAALGAFFEELSAAGVLEETLVVICGDHGEALGEHGEETHSVFLYDCTTRVPLIIRQPKQTAPARRKETVGLVDLAPTLRELCALPPLPGDGVSLVPLLKGQPGWTRKPVYLESLEALFSFGWAPLYAHVEGADKFILAPRVELYDLDRDPAEARNGAADRPEVTRRMRAALSQRLAAARTLPAQKLQLSDEELKSLLSLGYISGTGGQGAATYRDPKDGVAFMARQAQASRMLQEGRLGEATALFEALVKEDPKNPLTAFYLGQCYEPTDPAKALSLYRRALQSRKDFPQAYDRMTELLVNAGRFEEAFQLGLLALRSGVQDASGNTSALAAWAGLQLGRPAPELEPLLARAEAAAPDHDLSLVVRAALALKGGQPDQALALLARAAKTAAPGSLGSLDQEAVFAPLKEDPRFWKIVLDSRRGARR